MAGTQISISQNQVAETRAEAPEEIRAEAPEEIRAVTPEIRVEAPEIRVEAPEITETMVETQTPEITETTAEIRTPQIQTETTIQTPAEIIIHRQIITLLQQTDLLQIMQQTMLQQQ